MKIYGYVLGGESKARTSGEIAAAANRAAGYKEWSSHSVGAALGAVIQRGGLQRKVGETRGASGKLCMVYWRDEGDQFLGYASSVWELQHADHVARQVAMGVPDDLIHESEIRTPSGTSL